MTEIVRLRFPAQITTPSEFNEDRVYALLYLLHGYSLSYQQWQKILSLQSVTDKHNIIIVCPDGGRTFFMDSHLGNGIKYETFFFDELVPYIHRQYKIAEDKVFISGASMGGFGALHLTLKNTGYFAAAGSTSGSADFDYHFWKMISRNAFGSDIMIRDLEKLFGRWPENRETWHKRSLVNRIDESKMTGKPMIIDCGRSDPLFGMNEGLMDSLEPIENVNTKKLPGIHSYTYWEKSIKIHLKFFHSVSREKFDG